MKKKQSIVIFFGLVFINQNFSAAQLDNSLRSDRSTGFVRNYSIVPIKSSSEWIWWYQKILVNECYDYESDVFVDFKFFFASKGLYVPHAFHKIQKSEGLTTFYKEKYKELMGGSKDIGGDWVDFF